MAHTQVQWGRGNTAQVATYTGPAGELVLNTDDGSLHIQDGVTAGGKFVISPEAAARPLPQGRLTLTSGVPVQIADAPAATTVYYTPIGDSCPIYNGSLWIPVHFAEVSLPLDATVTDVGYHQSGKLFDVFAFLNAGVFAIGTGPAWTSTIARGSGAGTTQISQLNGLWVNTVAITLRFGSATGNAVSVPANQATYLGTMYATQNGQTAMVFAPAGALGGNGNVLGLWNAYNRVGVRARCNDSTSSWTYNVAAWRAADGSNNNRITWVDGLAQSFADAQYQVYGGGGTSDAGISFDAVATPLYTPNGSSSLTFQAADVTRPILGLRFVQAMELGAVAVNTYFGGALQLLTLRTEM